MWRLSGIIFFMFHCQVNTENRSSYCLVTDMSEKSFWTSQKGLCQKAFHKFLEELRKTRIDTFLTCVVCTEVLISVLNRFILSFRHNFIICSQNTLHETSVKLNIQRKPESSPLENEILS